jgi:hypothetical protein
MLVLLHNIKTNEWLVLHNKDTDEKSYVLRQCHIVESRLVSQLRPTRQPAK